MGWKLCVSQKRRERERRRKEGGRGRRDVLKELLSICTFWKSFLYLTLNWKLDVIWGLRIASFQGHTTQPCSWHWHEDPTPWFPLVSFFCVYVFGLTHTQQWQPRIKIWNRSFGKPGFVRMKQPLIYWDVSSMRVGTCLFLLPPYPQGLVYSRGSANTRQKNELGTTEHFGRSIVKGGPFFFFLIASIWSSGKAGKGPLP